MTDQLPTTFDPAEIEARWYAHWEENGLFRPERPDAEPFTIVNPPPNVTGSLHIGHALDNTLQDVVIRYERLRGKDALWVVGTDHAGIATQMVVERQLEERQDKRTNYSREDFVEKVWRWKEESGGTITRQLRRLGCSMDWSLNSKDNNGQFTMDEHFSKAVLKVFVDLYNDGLIYRDKRLVNWDPKLKTAISDLEVEQQTIAGHFWHFRYPLEDGVTLASGQDYIEVATTRPETMLADMAVAVHPDDERYASVVGKQVILPITGRKVPVVADEHADPELGSGAVKITPGHDFNDFEVGKRAGFAPGEMLNMLDAEANVCQTADGLIPREFLGLHRFRHDGVDGARELVVRRLKEQGFLIPHVVTNKAGEDIEHDAEPRQIATPFGDRGGVVIEPWLTDQWYVNAEELAKQPIAAVRSGEIEIIPKSWEKTFFNWMENIQPWCVSRQLWWGHRIPAWYDEEGEVYVAETEEEAYALARQSRGNGDDEIVLTRDEDVLDTWFSSALWPFATLGWPESSPSPDGEGDHAKHGGGVSPSAATDTPPPPSAVPLPGAAGEETGAVNYKFPPKTNAAVVRAKAMRRDMPPSEAILWRALKDRPDGVKFRRQHPAGNYVLDFFCPAAALAIEVDGEAHERADGPERDAKRDAFVKDCGVETLRIPAREVFRDVDAVVAGIMARVRERLPLHQPSASPPRKREGNSLLAKHYPNSLLISGFDILFFWDARMMMAGYYNMGEKPWPRLYLHGLVRAADGQKMSKSKGNVVDPLGLIDRYGADALRFFMAAMESQGRDIKMDEKRVEGYRNFATKLWNATRFCQSNGIGASTTLAAPEARLAANQWIIGEVRQTVAALDAAMAELRFDAAANAIYHFVWDRFCDWYLELIKPVFTDSVTPAKAGVSSGSAQTPEMPASAGMTREEGDWSPAAETRSVAGWALDQILVMLHPFMPFITEELWHAQGERPYELILAKWPDPQASVSKDATDAIDWVIELTTNVRSAKNELGIAPGAKLAAYLPEASDVAARTIERSSAAIERLARLTPVTIGEPPAGPAMQVTAGSDVFVVPLEGVIDIAAERARLQKALEASQKEAKSLEGRLGNANFVEKAKPEAVEKARADHAHHSAEVERLTGALARLG